MCEFILTNEVKMCGEKSADEHRKKEAEKVLSIIAEHFKEEVVKDKGIKAFHLWTNGNPCEYILYASEMVDNVFEFTVISMVFNVSSDDDEVYSFMELNTIKDNSEIVFSAY